MRLLAHLTPGILPFVVFQVFARFQLAPPPLVILVPARRLGQSLLEIAARLPPQGAYLSIIQGIAPVVARTVAHRLDKAFRLIQCFQDQVGDFDVAPLTFTT